MREALILYCPITQTPHSVEFLLNFDFKTSGNIIKFLTYYTLKYWTTGCEISQTQFSQQLGSCSGYRLFTTKPIRLKTYNNLISTGREYCLIFSSYFVS